MGRPHAASGPDPTGAPALRWGIIAPGTIARRFVTELHTFTSSRVVAVGSRSLDRAGAFAAEFGIDTAYGSYEEVAADQRVDAIYVASPTSHHRDHALLAVAAGKPALVEKAFARNRTEAATVFEAARQAGVFVMEAMWNRFLPHMYALREILASGVIGEIGYLSATLGKPYSHIPGMARRDVAGGSLLALGVYPVSLAHHLLGAPESVASGGTRTSEGVDGSVGIVLTYPHAVATLSTTMMVQAHNVAEISGTAGRIRLTADFHLPTSVIEIVPSDGQPQTIDLDVPGGFQFEAAEVARCLAAGRTESSLMSWSDTLGVMGTMDTVRDQIGVRYPGE